MTSRWSIIPLFRQSGLDSFSQQRLYIAQDYYTWSTQISMITLCMIKRLHFLLQVLEKWFHASRCPVMFTGSQPPTLTSPLPTPFLLQLGNSWGRLFPCCSTETPAAPTAGVYIAAGVIGRDKASCNFITDSPLFSMYGTPLLFSHKDTHSLANTLTSITTETKLSQVNYVRERKTQIKSRAVCSLNRQHQVWNVVLWLFWFCTATQWSRLLAGELTLIKSSLSFKDSIAQ